MNASRFFKALALAVAVIAAAGSAQEPAPTPAQAQSSGLRPIGLFDILTWKSMGPVAVSSDGLWVAYRVSPQEGDGEVVIRQTRGSKEYSFPAGEGRAGQVAISEDAKHCAFTVFPTAKEAKTLRKSRQTAYTKVFIVDLAKGDKVEYEKIKSFAFSGENPGWLALHKNAPEGQAREKDKWSGSDLVLRELATGKELTFGDVSEFAFDKHGRYLAFIIDASGMTGNGVMLRDMETGAVLSLDNGKANYKSLAWSEKGEAFACLKGKEDKAYEDKLFSAVGFSGFGAGPAKGRVTASSIQKIIYDPHLDTSFPAGFSISPNRPAQWTEDFGAVLFGISEPKKKEEDAKPSGGEPAPPGAAGAPGGTPSAAGPDEDVPDLVLWHYLDPRLQSQQQVQLNSDRNFSYLAEYRVAEKRFIRLADEEVRQVMPAPKSRYAVGFDSRAYDLDANLSGLRYRDVYVIDMKTGVRTLALKKCRDFAGISTDGTHFLYYENGDYYTHEMAAGKTFNLTWAVPASFVNEDDDHNVVKPADRSFGWSKDGRTVLLSDGWDIWSVPVHGGTKGVNLTVNGLKDQVRYQQIFRLDPEADGYDLAEPQYVSAYGEWTKKAGIVRIEKGKPGPTVLLWDDAGYGRLMKARKAEAYFYTRDTARDYPDLYVADANLKNTARLSDINPQQKDFLWSSGQMLLDYKMDPKSGMDKKLQAALFLPANYEEGKRYPTIVYYYEKRSQELNRYSQPSSNGFNRSVYTSNGYAVLIPDITYKINDPGMSAVWCVLPALDAAVTAGVVDRSKVGLHGHSWGGYQTAFLVTQADFAAAVAGAPLTNMISMYSSIYFNTGGANQPIFESSQGRFKGGYWENLEAFQRNSPVYYAQDVHTPLIILHNDKDGAVVWNQGIEYYNTLRRLKKPVIMLQYVSENHGLAKAANQKDYTVRMKEFFDHYLLGKAAPVWLAEGIPYLKMKDYLKEQAKLLEPAEKKEPGKKDEKK